VPARVTTCSLRNRNRFVNWRPAIRHTRDRRVLNHALSRRLVELGSLHHRKGVPQHQAAIACPRSHRRLRCWDRLPDVVLRANSDEPDCSRVLMMASTFMAQPGALSPYRHGDGTSEGAKIKSAASGSAVGSGIWLMKLSSRYLAQGVAHHGHYVSPQRPNPPRKKKNKSRPAAPRPPPSPASAPGNVR